MHASEQQMNFVNQMMIFEEKNKIQAITSVYLAIIVAFRQSELVFCFRGNCIGETAPRHFNHLMGDEDENVKGEK